MGSWANSFEKGTQAQQARWAERDRKMREDVLRGAAVPPAPPRGMGAVLLEIMSGLAEADRRAQKHADPDPEMEKVGGFIALGAAAAILIWIVWAGISALSALPAYVIAPGVGAVLGGLAVYVIRRRRR